jgi:hypothetical protein
VDSISSLLRAGVNTSDEDAPAGDCVSCDDALRLIEEAEVLGLPWKEILQREIQAEGTLQRFLGTDVRDVPLWRALSIIPHTLFHSWRVRQLVDRRCFEASTGSRKARRELTSLLRCLSGPSANRVTERMALARHYWFAYQRVLELEAVALAAERRSEPGERTSREICESTGCSRRDADWAAARLTSPSRSHPLDDAVARAREEGFEIPHAASELQAFSRLRRFVSRCRLDSTSKRGKRGVQRRNRRSAVPSPRPHPSSAP